MCFVVVVHVLPQVESSQVKSSSCSRLQVQDHPGHTQVTRNTDEPHNQTATHRRTRKSRPCTRRCRAIWRQPSGRLRYKCEVAPCKYPIWHPPAPRAPPRACSKAVGEMKTRTAEASKHACRVRPAVRLAVTGEPGRNVPPMSPRRERRSLRHPETLYIHESKKSPTRMLRFVSTNKVGISANPN